MFCIQGILLIPIVSPIISYSQWAARRDEVTHAMVLDKKLHKKEI
jgi:hypothetical protein